jgi:hypothetical protein
VSYIKVTYSAHVYVGGREVKVPLRVSTLAEAQLEAKRLSKTNWCIAGEAVRPVQVRKTEETLMATYVNGKRESIREDKSRS